MDLVTHRVALGRDDVRDERAHWQREREHAEQLDEDRRLGLADAQNDRPLACEAAPHRAQRQADRPDAAPLLAVAAHLLGHRVARLVAEEVAHRSGRGLRRGCSTS